MIETYPDFSRKYPAIFVNLRKCFETVGQRSYDLRPIGQLLGNLRKVFRNLKNGKMSKTCLCNKKNVTLKLEDMNFMLSRQEQYLIVNLHCSCQSNIKLISSCYRVIVWLSVPYSLLFFGHFNLSKNNKTNNETTHVVKSLKTLICELEVIHLPK